MKYTKGKWEARCQVDDPNVYSDDRCEGEEFDVYVVHPPRHLLGNRETLIADHISAGDANLIANSPLMLEALKMVVDYHDRDEDNETDLHFENARDAIAKAEGK